MPAVVIWRKILSDLFVNLSAGWFGAALVIPAFSSEPVQVNLLVLTGDALMGTLFLGIAFVFRREKL